MDKIPFTLRHFANEVQVELNEAFELLLSEKERLADEIERLKRITTRNNELLREKERRVERADYEHFKDRSRLKELPCNVGDTVYYFNSAGEIFSQKVSGFIVNFVGILVDSDVMFDSNLIGERFFLTREEAERALKLKERENNA